MSGRTMFAIGFIVAVGCVVGAGVTNDMHLKSTSEALGAVAGVIGPILVLWFFLGVDD